MVSSLKKLLTLGQQICSSFSQLWEPPWGSIDALQDLPDLSSLQGNKHRICNLNQIYICVYIYQDNLQYVHQRHGTSNATNKDIVHVFYKVNLKYSNPG